MFQMQISIEQLEKISQMLIRYGIRNISMEDIAKELGISKKTIYKWFPSKEIMIEKVIDSMISQVQSYKNCDEDVENNSENAIDVIFNVMAKIGEMISKINPIFFWELNKYYPVQAKKLNDFRKNHIREKYYTNLKRGIDEGIYRGNINIEIVSQILITGIMNFDETINEETLNNYSIKDILKEKYLFYLHAIVNDKGREYLQNKIKMLEL